MEFLRFGSSIPGSYWGCCACCIIQNFKVDPDAKASIELVSGDGNNPLQTKGETAFVGPTWRDIFWNRLRFGTFSTNDMPNHAFFAILTESQINGTFGKQWLEILREAGFEFIRTVCNSVYSGPSIIPALPASGGSSQNHIFGLFRNIGSGAIADPFTPPKAWTDLPKVKTDVLECVMNNEFGVEGMSFNDLAKIHHAEDLAIWNKIGPPKFLTEAEVVAAGAPVILAGQRSSPAGGVTFPQQPKANRDTAKAVWDKKLGVVAPASLRSPEVTAVAPALPA